MLRSIIMGVAGCGKSSVGEALAEKLSAHYIDGDDLHPKSNIEKMAAGIPLDDADRAPWLAEVGTLLAGDDGPIFVGCSALKRSYRDIIRSSAGAPVFFLHLHGTRELIEGRMRQRSGHFMPTALLDSQFATLELLQPDEIGAIIEIDGTLDDVVAQSIARLKDVQLSD